MAKQSLNGVLQHLRKVAAVETCRELPDCDLLESFVGARDEAAFTALIERHGPMVLGVCRRSLADFHDAEDACQATFLVLARRAASVRKKTSLSSWLHGVACRVAANLKRDHARRKSHERAVDARPPKDPAAEVTWREVQAILDEELQRLPERYRAPVILCYLECMTRDEAAKQLGLSFTTMHGRLERARDVLREHLTKRGLTLSAVMSAAALGESVAQAALAPTFVVTSTKAAMLLAAGQPVTEGVVATNVLALAQEVLKSMFLTKLKLGTAAVLCAGLFAALIGGSVASLGIAQDAKPKAAKFRGAVSQEQSSPQAKKPKTEKRSGILWTNDIDLVKATIKGMRCNTNPERTFWSGGGEHWELDVKPTTKITIDGKDAKFADLQTIKVEPHSGDGMKFIFVEAELEPYDGRKDATYKGSAIRIDATGIKVKCVVQAVNVNKNTVTIKKTGRGFDGEFVIDRKVEEVQVAKNVPVKINGRAVTSGDLKPNTKVSLQMSAVKDLVLGITAYGATVEGVLKAVDTEKNAVSVTIPSAQLTAGGVAVAKNAKVIIDGKEGKLSDLKAGMRVTLQMSAEPDESVIIGITNEKAR
ncbi:MAG: sigma-70 family RNA polymerase sigma factor [Planctomycetes bacterium]|nr:sigma-70 family RNA polymerase sigma factor [Planctomycetota bacterium]